MTSLIERLEAAEGPDRELEQDIYHALGLCGNIHVGGEPAGCADYTAPNYTSSLDAAMQLVPEGWWKIEAGCDGAFFASCAPWDVGTLNAHKGCAAAPAIALTIAALKSRGIQ